MADFYVDANGRITSKKRNKNKILPNYAVNTNGDILLVEEDEEDIAPVKTTVSQTENKDRTWFQKSALFDDGYQFGDVSKTILGSKVDVGENIGAGIIGMGEKALDALMWAAPYIAQGQYYSNGGGYNIAANQAFDQSIGLAKEETEKFIEKDLYNEEEIAKTIISNPVKNLTGIDAETDSVFGEKSDALAQSAGQLGATVALSAAGVPWWVTTGATAFGGEVESALNQGATMEEAGLSAAITAGAEILTEKLSGGISFGGNTLDDVLVKELARTISNKTLRTMAKLGMDAVGEGAEEVISQVFSNLGSALYKEESLNEILFSEETFDEYIESFIGGAVLGGGSSAINAIKSNKQGVDSVTGLTANEQQVVDKVYEDRVAEKEKSGKIDEKAKRKIYDEVLSDLDRGGIDIDTIEEVLGGETYSNYKKLADAEAKMQDEYDALGKKEKYTLADDARYKELGERLKYVREKGAKNEMRKRLDDEVSSMVKDSRLSESFAERSRRGQAFEADLTQYDEKQRAIVQKAAESGILNNTRRTHDFVDLVAKIGAEKGITFDFANNAKLKESGFAVEGKTVNGYVTKDGITVNIQSAKALDTVVGHEITHVLEGTELYAELQTAAIEYAKTKGDYQGRYDALVKMYESVKDADIDAELTADIVGEYLFTDTDFINNLSANHRNVFQKIYDEIKYLLKVATAGSKEARQLEQVKRAFEKAYRDGGKNKTAETGGVKRSISETTDGRIAAVVDNDILANIDTSSWDNAKKEAAKKAASEALKQFSGGIVVNGITRKVNRISRNEYTRSEYAEKLFRNKPNVFADKMRAADVADDIVVAATNWTRDGGLKHPRTDNFVDFDHGTTLIVSGDAKYTAEVVVGITANGDAVFYDVVDLEPTTFDTKKAESPTTATTQNAIGDTHEDSAGGTVSQNDADVKYSINEVTEDGLTMTYVRVPNQNTQNYGSTYGQNIEPAGEYMSMDTMQGSHKIDGYEYGTIQFKKPLVLEHINTGETGWKKTVSDMYGGLTGKKLSAALIKDGYDAIVTYDEYGYNEIVNLNGTKLDNPQAGAKSSLSADSEGARPVSDGNYGRYHVYGRDIALETAEDIAPVAAPATDIAPAVAESVAYEEPMEDESPYAELDRLTEQAEALEQQMYEAMDAGDNEKAMEINADLVDAAMRITELEQQLDADTQERLASMEDADAPVVREAPYSESTDTVTLPKKTVQDIAKDARAVLGFSPRRSAEMRTLIEKFSQGEIDSEQLHDEIAQRFHTITEKGRLEDVAEVRNWLRRARLNVTDDIKSEYNDYLNEVYKPNRGRILFANDGATVDQFYAEASSLYPGFFPADIINPADQLQRIVEVANMDIKTERSYELDQELLESVTDNIVRGVNEYRSTQRLKMSEQDARAAFNGLMADADRYAPPTEDDIAPVRAAVMQPAQESVPTAKQPIKTVKERLEAKLQNLQTELKTNLQLREESRADYELEILQAQTAYNALENKNTQKANTLLRRVERLRRISGNEDARYAKRISDLETQVDKANEELRTGESTEAQGAMRQELHARIVENIRAKFAERGYDLETVLKNAKDLSTFATVDNTPQRVMEKALGYKEGQILSDLTVNQVAENETKGIRWLNGYTDRKNGLLAQISKQYGIKPGSKESAAAQMYAEGFYVAENEDIIEYGDRELAADFPDAKVQENIKGLARDPRIRQIYDATLAMINESRARNAYPEIQKLDNYFLHFRAMDDTFSRLGIPFNPNDIKAKDLPTDLNGVTADLKPGQPYFASAMHRKGKRTSFDLLGGLEKYLTSAKGQIYHIDDIQTLRALRNHIAETYGQAHGLDGLDALTEEEAQEHIRDVYDGHLSTFAKFLNEEANVIAGKTALIDRGLEGIIGRRGMTFFDTLNRQVGANMVGFNVSSSLTNFIAPVQAFAKTNKAAFVKGFAQTVANRVGSIAGKGDGFAENNPTMIRREGADRFYRTPWQKAGDIGYALMGAVDSLSTEIIVRSKYNELVSKGMSHEQAVTEADKWASRLMGDRSLGQMPQLYNSKMAGLITKFQLEVRNQLDSQFYDTIQEAKVSAEDVQNKLKRNAKVAAQVTSTFVQLAVVQHLFGKAFEAVAGYNPAFDIIEAIIKAFGWDDEEESEDTVLDNLGQGLMSLAEDMPYSSVITGTGRIPISAALPIGQFVKGEDKYGNEKSRWETLAETAPYYLLPGGYGQIKKTTQGLGMFDEDLPIAGSYTNSGNLRFPVEDTLANRVQAAVFGQYASSNARDYFDNERQSLKKNQIQELVDVDIPIREYWDYRAGLNEQETLADKFDYIADLDLPIDKKNILINNVVDRKEAVDLADYDDYANYEEFDFAVKNPEKYDFLQSVGVSVAEYQSFDDDTKDAYNWAYENPDKYMVSRAVTDDVAVYRQYTKALNDIKADKNAEGKSISGSRKAKVVNYLNGLDADYYTKIILFKMEYNADDTYNREIIEYLNGRNDISFEEEVTILKELGFTVTADGTVRW